MYRTINHYTCCTKLTKLETVRKEINGNEPPMGSYSQLASGGRGSFYGEKSVGILWGCPREIFQGRMSRLGVRIPMQWVVIWATLVNTQTDRQDSF